MCVCMYICIHEGGNTKIKKEEVKPSLLTDDIIIYIEQLKKLIENVWNQLDEYSMFSGYKVNTQKTVTLLYTSNEQVIKTWN